MREYSHIRTDKTDGILTITFDRPERLNAVNSELHRDLSWVFADAREEPNVTAVILTGAGRAFSAGGDYQWFVTMHQNREAIATTMVEAKKLIVDLLQIEQPVIAAVNGDAVGLGATIALFCDEIILSESARIGDPHVRVGLVAGDGGAVIWPLLCGMARAKHYLLSGDLIKAPDALQMGLVNQVVPAEEVVPAARAYAQKLAQGAGLAIRYTKQALNNRLLEEVQRTLDLSLMLEGHSMHSDDFAEAGRAMLEKRPPRFTGR